MKKYINPLSLIISLENKDKGVNKIFGPSPVVNTEDWPREDGIFYNHIISLETSDLNFPTGKNVGAISIFMVPPALQQNKTQLFEIVMVDKKNINTIRTDYPEEYKPWWNENPKEEVFKSGVPYTLDIKKDIPESIIAEAIYYKGDFYPIPPELEEIEDYGSYVGGFPIWIQGNETPKQDNGENAHFIMKLSGFDTIFQMSLIDGFDVYLFLTEKGKLLSIGQS